MAREMNGEAMAGQAEAAVAIVRAGAPRDSILLIRRTEHPLDPWSGHWAFPGGHCDDTDADLLHTALRELDEECGVRLTRESLRAELAPVVARRRTPPFVLVAPFEFAVDRELPTVLDPEEAVAAVWMPLSRWRDPAMHTLRPVPGMPEHWLFPAIDLDAVPVWGFTYRLTTEWLELLPQKESRREAGFQLANRLLDLLASGGAAVKRGWTESAAAPRMMGGQPPVKVATVGGAIPNEHVAAWLRAPGSGFPAANVVEIRPELIRIVGLDLEEYLIQSQP